MPNEKVEIAQDGAAEQGESLTQLLNRLRVQGSVAADVKTPGVYEMLADAGLVERATNEKGKEFWQVTKLGCERGISQRPLTDGSGSYLAYDELGAQTVLELLSADADGSAYKAAKERADAAAKERTAKRRFPETISDENALCRRGERFVPDFVERAAPLIGRNLITDTSLDAIPGAVSLRDLDHDRPALLKSVRTPRFDADRYGWDERKRYLEKKNSANRTVQLDADMLRSAFATRPDCDLYVYVRWERLAMGDKRVTPLEGVWVASLADIKDKVDQGLLAHLPPIAGKAREGESRDIYLISLRDPVFTKLWSREGKAVLAPLELDEPGEGPAPAEEAPNVEKPRGEASASAPRKRLIPEESMRSLRDALFEGWDVLEKGVREMLPSERKCVIAPDFSPNEGGTQDKVKYDEPLSRLYYFLRYGYGYAYEYYLMWKDLLDDMEGQGLGSERLDVLSLGCGNGVDLWALRTLLEERGEPDRLEGYVGVDVADWSDLCFPLPEGADYRYRWNCSALDYLKSAEARRSYYDKFLCARVVVFPKSLGEMSEDEIESIGDVIGKQNMNSWYYLCVCPPHGYKNMEGLWDNDPAMREKLSCLLGQVGNNIRIDDAIRGEEHYEDKRISKLTDEAWRGHLSGKDEDSLMDMLSKKLPLLCPKHEETTCAKARCPLEMSPILRGKFPCYRIYYLDGLC